MQNHGTELIVALDFPRPDRAFELVEELDGEPVLFKVGLELFTAGGPDFVRELVYRKKRVFLDLKFHDIPNTVARAAQQAALLHVEMFSLHLSGGSAMVRAVAEVMEEISLLRPKIIGVSVLTSFDDVRWAEVTKSLTGHAVDAAESVAGLVEHAVSWGADGVVCSSLELPTLRSQFPSLYTVVPGIRPEGTSPNDQARIMTPAQARAAGANAIVVGRPITEAKSPRHMVQRVLKELSEEAVSA
ncbi:MAG: orotidine 5'-phosphate decarboxylase [Bdellovibrionales bacterium GWB1_55_8]|nr:MAG: orotidine 5'-phosphate decarboxylase [Bdellovibrionales bacterium GWB1_55_8]